MEPARGLSVIQDRTLWLDQPLPHDSAGYTQFWSGLVPPALAGSTVWCQSVTTDVQTGRLTGVSRPVPLAIP